MEGVGAEIGLPEVAQFETAIGQVEAKVDQAETEAEEPAFNTLRSHITSTTHRLP